MTMPPRDEFLTAQEVAIILRVSKMTVYRLVEADELAHVRVGRGIRIPERSVAAFIAQGGNDAHALTSPVSLRGKRRLRPI